MMKNYTKSLLHLLVAGIVILSASVGAIAQIKLKPVGSYSAGKFAVSAAEIPAYHAASKKLFVVNALNGKIDIIDISSPASPDPSGYIDVAAESSVNGTPNSVAVHGNKLAIAVENAQKQQNGTVLIFDVDANGQVSNKVEVAAGALPDMLTFTHNGAKIIVANEGEPSTDYTMDPEGSITIIDVATGQPTQLGFGAYNDKKAALQNMGVNIYGNDGKATVAQDLEPEYVAVSKDDSQAFITLQENNAFAIVDLTTNTLVDIVPMGYKNHNSGTPKLTEFNINELVDLPKIGLPHHKADADENYVRLSGFSGLWFDAANSTQESMIFYTVPDRGPNDAPVAKASLTTGTAPQNLRPFTLPNYQGRIAKFELNPMAGTVQLLDQIMLTAKDGTTPITGKGNISGVDEVPVTYTGGAFTGEEYAVGDVKYHALAYDPLGGDFEGILKDKEGFFWMCDEYRPAIYKFYPNGVLAERYVAAGTAAMAPGEEASKPNYGTETLPAVYSKRWANRGFEAIAYDKEADLIYAFVQSPMFNPGSVTKNVSNVIRILGVNAADGTPVAEYVYLLEREGASAINAGVDKIGDAVYMGNGKFRVIERDSSLPTDTDDAKTGKKFIFEINLLGATNILGTDLANKMESANATDKTLEMMSAKDLADNNITPVNKIKVLNLPSIGYTVSDKAEGLAMLPNGAMAVINDNDFGTAGAGFTNRISLGIINFGNNYRMDASNKDDMVNLQSWPTYGMFQPDAITSFAKDGKTYYITANEGDSRDYDAYSEEERVRDVDLSDALAQMAGFTSANDLQDSENLGRIKMTTSMGDLDGNGSFDQLFTYGARSFSIWDNTGNLVYDSGDDFESITSFYLPEDFNSTNDATQSFDDRSDDKGPEPEAVTTGMINGTQYAFIGLERVGGIMVYDINEPTMPRFVTYVNNRDFAVAFDGDGEEPTTEQLAAVKDLGPEGILFIDAANSPNGKPLLVVANEVSGTTTIFEIGEAVPAFTLAVMHNNDGESQLVNAGSGLDEFGGVARFKALVDKTKAAHAAKGRGTIMLSSGDNYLAGPEFNASLALDASASYYDAVAMDKIGYDAICLGNHDFDFGPDVLAKFISGFAQSQVPFLSANLNFAAENNLQALFDNGRIKKATIVNINGDKVGVIGATTDKLPYISSPRGVVVDPNYLNAINAEITALKGQGVNKIILISHLQSIEEEKTLIASLADVDIVIAGGGDELLAGGKDAVVPGEREDIYAPYPIQVKDATNKMVYVITTPGEYKYLGNLVVEFDANGEVIKVLPESGPIVVTDVKEDADVMASVVEPIKNYLSGLESNIIATSDVVLDGTRNHVRTQETNQGNLIADAMKWQAEQLKAQYGIADLPMVGIQNGGGIRNNNEIAAGNITELMTWDMLPFANYLAVVEDVEPALLLKVMENTVSRVEYGDGRFAQIAGFKVVYDASAEPMRIDDGNITQAGERIRSIELMNGTKIIDNGEVVSGAPNVNVAIADFSARGGDQYPFDGKAFKILGVNYQKALFNYIKAADGLNGTISATQYPAGGQGRISNVAMDSPSLMADNTDNQLGNAIEITFADDADWRNAIVAIMVGDTELAANRYTVEAGKITIEASVFTEAAEYGIGVKSTGYYSAMVTQSVNLITNAAAPTKNGVSVYPSLATEFITIGLGDASTGSAVIVNAQGAVASIIKLTDTETQVPVGSLTAGAYYVVIGVDGVFVTKTIIVK